MSIFSQSRPMQLGRSAASGRQLLAFVRTRRGLGVLLVLLSAASFGAVTPFARLAFDAGANVVTVMTVRYAVAGAAVFGYLAWRQQPWKLAGRRLWQTLGLALVLGLLSFLYLDSVRFIPVSLAALIYYTYPILVSLLAHITKTELLGAQERGAHVVAFGGQGLSLGGLALLLGLSVGALNLRGVSMAALAAISFALVMVFGGQLLRAVTPMVLNLYVALVNTALFALVGVLGAGFAWPAATAGWLGLLGVAVFFTGGFLGLFAGVGLIGPSRAACLTNVEPVVTIALAITVLGEPFGLWQFAGAGAVLVGIFIMCRNVAEDGNVAQGTAHTGSWLCEPDCPLCGSQEQRQKKAVAAGSHVRNHAYVQTAGCVCSPGHSDGQAEEGAHFSDRCISTSRGWRVPAAENNLIHERG